MLRNMVTSLIKHERIRTTTPKAKTLGRRRRLVTYAKKSDQRHGMNLAARIVREQGALESVRGREPRYAATAATRACCTWWRRRRGDAAPMSVIEVVGSGRRACPNAAVICGSNVVGLTLPP